MSTTTIDWVGAAGAFGEAEIPDAKFVPAEVRMRREMEAGLSWQAHLIDAVQQSIITTDLKGIVTSINHFAENMYGWKAVEVIGRDVRSLVYLPEEFDLATAGLAEVARGATVSREREVKRKDGRRIWISVTASPMRDVDGVITHIVATSTDITERRRLEEQFNQAQKMEAVGRLAGGVAHDFNNLLTVIHAHAEFLSFAIPAESEQREDVEAILKSIDRAAGLTRQLLTFSRQQVMETKVIHPNAVVADLEKMLSRLIGEDIELRIDLRPDVPMVLADPGQLEQAIVNLIVNARDAMPRGGPLRISTYPSQVTPHMAASHEAAKPGLYAAICVTDSGTGMSPAVLARIFEPFFTTKEIGRGTGLGLATVYGMVKQSGGFIDVESTERKGSSFTILLPATCIPARSADLGGAEIEADRGHETVLIVEDQPEVRAIATRILTARGYNVVEAANGMDALEWVNRNGVEIDMLITDAIMPRMGGARLIEAIRARAPAIPVLIVSGYTDQELSGHGVLEMKAEFLRKPFRSEELVRRVRAMLDAAIGE